MFTCFKTEKNEVNLLKVIKKITEFAHGEPPQKAAYSQHSISMAGCVTAVLAFVCGKF